MRSAGNVSITDQPAVNDGYGRLLNSGLLQTAAKLGHRSNIRTCLNSICSCMTGRFTSLERRPAPQPVHSVLSSPRAYARRSVRVPTCSATGRSAWPILLAQP